MEFVQKLMKKLGRSSKRKTILFAALDSIGHINSLVSLANRLKARGHRTVFLLNEPIANNLKDLGHEVYDSTTPDLVQSVEGVDAQDKWNEVMKMFQKSWQSGNIINNYELDMQFAMGAMVADIKKYNHNVEEKLKLIKPDILVIDHYFGTPALFTSNLPWVRVYSASPLDLYNNNKNNRDMPEAWLGLPSKWDQSDPSQREWIERARVAKQKLYEEYNAYWRSFGLPDLPLDPIGFIPVSPYLNVYMYPEELDYSEFCAPENWHRCDCMVRDQKAAKFEVPEELCDKPGKLIFLSLGSMASADVTLMKRLTGMLADCPHRFIVAKGPLHDQYELPDNMWGDKFLPQLEILAISDLVITHGGNNTLTESFYYGVPGFIVCPLFGDQFDNATRLQEKGLGIRLDPYNCSREALHSAIETMLSKHGIREKMQTISKRMQQPEARNKSLKLISDFVRKH